MHSPTQRADNIPLAAASLLASVFALSLGDALVKKFNATFTLWQIFILRSLLAAPLLALFLKMQNAPLLPRRLAWGGLRAALLALMTLVYYISLLHLPLSAAAAVWYTTPIMIVLLAAMFLGGRVGARGWGAVLLGFCGVLLILRPRAGDFNPWALLPLLAALLYAFAMIITRMHCRDEHPLALTLALHLAYIALGAAGFAGTFAVREFAPEFFGGGFLSPDWRALGAAEIAVMGALAAAALVGSIGAAAAYMLAPPSVVAPFDFAYLAFVAVWSVLLFAEFPDAAGALGIVAITAAGLLALRR